MECTGVAASWCPRCGDCNCPRNNDGERMAESDDCPLHGSSSQHAIEQPVEGWVRAMARGRAIEMKSGAAELRATWPGNSSVERLAAALDAARPHLERIADAPALPEPPDDEMETEDECSARVVREEMAASIEAGLGPLGALLDAGPKKCPGGDHLFEKVPDLGHCAVCGYGHK